ncbi:prepilin-type N-terminal cleavage/methylation domain-containing protein [Candidatus Pelagibacter sp.]|jgi:hypothetical protein|nr:prepilin-type N-terminal cleavage/methylation domain-containing protein [Candidatus Pelagibacter sp.]MDB9936148.1 prepilin-type N-terminal cleavage/methylation domain-containing protein [Candidatus Pelagibacter sp.]|tara:strand:- start:1058 stop:1741 length:684 start_codon:yes stop_codon:yes gene_type:complete
MPLYTCSKNKISGITLVEVMIGLVVTAVITISVYASYAAVNRSYEHVNRLSSVDQNSNKIFYLLGQDFKKIEYIEYGDVNILQSNHPSFTISAVSGSTVFDNIDIIYVENDLIYKSQYSITIADDTTTLTKSVTKLDVAVGTWAVDAADDLTHSPMMISRSLTKFKFKIINEKGEIISQPTTRSALLSAQIKVISLEAEQIIRKDNSNLTKTDLASATFFLKNLIHD